ncbi:MAG: hypothetical protein Q8K75_00865 [Chlamydiales bacterium]|nr:hypothetical protein [Chlamydiales bacterium]
MSGDSATDRDAGKKILDIFEKGRRFKVLDARLVASIAYYLAVHRQNFESFTLSRADEDHFLDNIDLFLDKMGGQDLSSVIWLMAVFKLGDNNLLKRALERSMLFINRMNFTSISNLAWSLRYFEIHDSHITKKLADRANEVASSGTPSSVVTFVRCFAEFGYPNAKLMDTLADMLIKVRGQLKPLQIAQSLGAYAKLRVHNEELTRRFADKLDALGGGLDTFALSLGLWAAAELGVRPSAVTHMIKRVPDLRANFSPSQLSLILSAYATLGIRDNQQIKALVDLLSSHVKNMRFLVLAETTMALAKLGIRDDLLIESIAEQAIKFAGQNKDITEIVGAFADLNILQENLMKAYATRTIGAANNLSLNNILDALSILVDLDYSNEQLMQALAPRFIKQIERAVPREWIKVLNAYAKLGGYDESLIKALTSHLNTVVNDMPLWAVRETASAFARLRTCDQQLLASLQNQVRELLPEVTPNDAAILIGAFNTLGVSNAALMQSLKQIISPLESPSNVVEIDFTQYPHITKRVLSVIESCRKSITGSLYLNRGAIDLNDEDVAYLRVRLEEIASAAETRPFCQAFYKYLGIYDSSVSVPQSLFASAPPIQENLADTRVMAAIASDFYDLWMRSAKLAIEGIKQSPSGLVLVEQEEGIYLPLTYSREHCLLTFHCYQSGDDALLTSLMKKKDGLIQVSSAGSLNDIPNLIVINKKRKKTRATPELEGKKRKASSGTHELADTVNPFKFRKLAENQKVSSARNTQPLGSTTEQISQRYQVRNLPADVAELQAIVAEQVNVNHLANSDRTFLSTFFPNLQSDEALASVFNAFKCKRPISVFPSQLAEEHFFSLMVLWLMSGEKCVLGLPCSDLDKFAQTFIEKLNSFQESNPLCLAWKITNGHRISDSHLRALLKDERVPLKIRLQLCYKLPLRQCQASFSILKRSITQLRDTEEFQTFSKGYDDESIAVEEFVTKIMEGKELDDALKQCKQFAALPDQLSALVRKTTTAQETHAAIATSSFVITTESLLAECFCDSLKKARLLIPLSDGKTRCHIYDSVPKNRLVLLDDQSSVEKQLRLMQIYGISRATLRMKELIKMLSGGESNFNYEAFAELLALCAMTKRIIKDGRLAPTDSRGARVDEVLLSYTSREKAMSIQEGVIHYFRPQNLGGKYLKSLSGDCKDIIYVISSQTPNIQRYIKQLKISLVFNNFQVNVISGKCRKRDLVANTEKDPRVTIITQRVLPSILPNGWKVLVDPQVKQLGTLSYHKGKVIRLLAPSNKGSQNMVRACFGDGGLPMLETALKQLLKELLERNKQSSSLYQQIEQAILKPDTIAKLSDILYKKTLPVQSIVENDTILLDGVQLRPIPIPRDGHCLFQCLIEAGLSSREEGVQQCRNKISDLIEQKRDQYMALLGEEEFESMTKAIRFYEGPFKEDYEDLLMEVQSLRGSQNPRSPAYFQYSTEFLKAFFDLYVTLLKETSMWGGFIELDAVANHFKRQIVIQKQDGEVERMLPANEEFDGTFFLEHDGAHYTFLKP